MSTPQFSYLIPSTPEMNALTWMLRTWQSEFPQGATIDTVARHCVEASALAFGEPVEGMKNDEYQRVYMLSFALAEMHLLYSAGPGNPASFKPVRPWYEYKKPAPSPQSAHLVPAPQDQTLSVATTSSERCTYRLREQKKPYPRTCEICGLGPCHFPTRERSTPL